MSKVHVDALQAAAQLVREETPAEIEARTAKDLADSDHARWKDKCLFVGAGGVGLLVTVIALVVAVWGSDAETRKWAQGVVTALVAGLVGYLVGKRA